MAVWKFCFQNRLSNPVINSPCRCEHITFKHHPSKCSKWVARLLMWLQRDNTTTSFIAAITILRFGGRLYFSFDVDILVLSYSVANCNPVTIYWCDNYYNLKNMDSVQFSCSVMSDSLRPHESHSMPGLPVHHKLLEFTQTHAHWVGYAIQPSHLLSSPSPPALNLSQHQGLFQRVSSSHQVARVLEFQLQHQSFQWTLRTDILQDGLVGSPCSPRDSQESSPTPQFKSINFSVLSFLHSPTLTSIHNHWKNHCLD